MRQRAASFREPDQHWNQWCKINSNGTFHQFASSGNGPDGFDLFSAHGVDAVVAVERQGLPVEPVEGGVRTTSAGTMEREGSDRPVLVAETIGVTYD